eukprot:gnl/MRDRNA2_/MRDRNA2_101479_c0_seq1.p1 gnl/MRDRNA2_/MRDRNA2_101479_c0~~gnl/MRDRNA2_/MRDRNA2_101479_c0_seq1.p1  ORF type:complete len:165 (-),score=16.85 gnl/MRDRNA2_/MRDRNA2_101479_c0_seq1:172-666(-)
MSGALTGQVWKIHNKPERFVNPPLITNPQVTAHKQCMKKELHTTALEVEQKMRKIGDIYRPNSFFAIYRPHDEVISDEHEFTLDQIMDSMSYDQMIPRDTNHPRHTSATMRRCKSQLRTKRPLRTSQSYGSLPPIDIAKYGFGTSSVCQSSFMDHSHLRSSGFS